MLILGNITNLQLHLFQDAALKSLFGSLQHLMFFGTKWQKVCFTLYRKGFKNTLLISCVFSVSILP